jgi:PAS domain S-box-containing protein
MGKETTAQKKMNELRQQAEKLLEKKAGKRVMSTDDMFKLSHELAVHQIELEMQAEELQQAQIELEKSRDKYIELFDFAPLGYFTLNKNNIIIEANLTAAKLLDMERRNLIRSKFTKFIAPESQDIFYSVYRKDFEPGGKRGCEIYMRRKDGTRFAASLEGVTRPDEEGHLTRRLIIVTDITERKRIEDSLSRSEEQFRNIFEKSPIGIGLCDDNGLLITCNQACLDVFGITDINEMRGFQFFKDLNITDDAKAILRRREIVKYEFSYDFKKVKKAKLYKTAKSGIIQLDIVVSPLFAAGQKIIGYLVHVQDITERKKAQDYVFKARDELEVQVKQRTARLERSIKELRLLASRLTLAEEHERRRIAKIFHDTFGQRMSLCSIQLGRLIRISTSDDFTQRLKEIQDNVKGILSETRQFIFEVSPAVLYDFGLEVALERLAAVFEQKHNILIYYKDDGKSKHLDEDIRVMLFQMTRELLMNVVKHAKAHRIEVSTIRRGRTIRITVQDDGVGFDKKILKTKGSEGMGLFSIGERITQVGGSAEVKSKIGGGTVITLAAPLKQKSVKNTISPITNLEP